MSNEQSAISNNWHVITNMFIDCLFKDDPMNYFSWIINYFLLYNNNYKYGNYYSFFIVHCSMIIAFCSLFVAHCLLLIVCCSLLFAHCLLLIVCCSLFV